MAGKPDKETQKRLKAEKRAASKQRRAQIWQAFQMQRKQDKLLLPLMIGSVVGAAVVAFLIGLVFGLEWIFLVFGVAIGVMIAISIFGRRVQRSVYAQADGQPGAAGWALDQLRGQWRVTQGVAGTTHLDAVHRVVGRPGVVLVAEGAPHRVKSLLAQEKKRTARVVGQTPIYDVVVGNEEGQVPLKGLQRHLMKLPRNISAAEMESLDARLAALGNRAAALPKGPLPQGAKMRSVQRTVRRR
jgi:F0F1-type ATP synthase assembly protein I